jgi:hypothetical protein
LLTDRIGMSNPYSMVGSIYGQSSMKIAHFVLICWQTWPPQAILVSVWSISKNILWNCLAKWTESLQLAICIEDLT